MKISNIIKYSQLAFLLLSLTGCAHDKTLSPPDDAEWLTVSMILPHDIEATPLKVMYRSESCRKDKRSTATGDSYTISDYSYHEYDVESKGQGQYEKRIAIQGGGSCGWALSNIMLSIRYKDTGQFASNITENYSARIVVVFDDNQPQVSSGLAKVVQGDIVIEKEFYLLISEMRLGEYSKALTLFGVLNPFMYRANNTKNILFKPIVHSDSVVKWLSVKDKNDEKGNTVIYPDNSIEYVNGSKPDFEKLQAIKKSKSRESD